MKIYRKKERTVNIEVYKILKGGGLAKKPIVKFNVVCQRRNEEGKMSDKGILNAILIEMSKKEHTYKGNRYAVYENGRRTLLLAE